VTQDNSSACDHTNYVFRRETRVTAYIVLQEGYFSLNRDALAAAASDADA